MKSLIALMIGAILLVVAMGAMITQDTTNEQSDHNYGKICLDGVVYWKGYRTIAVKYNQDGTVALCGDK